MVIYNEIVICINMYTNKREIRQPLNHAPIPDPLSSLTLPPLILFLSEQQPFHNVHRLEARLNPPAHLWAEGVWDVH